MICWDTSALQKCYFSQEAAHDRAMNLLTKTRGHQGSWLLWSEATGAITRRFAGKVKTSAPALDLLEDNLKDFHLATLDEPQVRLAVTLIRKRSLRGADALHLAAALIPSRELGRRSFRFVSADREQLDAARAEGLRVIDLAP